MNKIPIKLILIFLAFPMLITAEPAYERLIIKIKTPFEAGNSDNEKITTGIEEIDMIILMNEISGARKMKTGKLSNDHFIIVTLNDPSKAEMLLKLFSSLNSVEFVEYDYQGEGGSYTGIVPNDPHYYRQWGLKNDGSFSLSTAVTGADIDMELAWNITQGDSNIVVGVMDSGFKLDHPDFAGRIWINHAEIPNNLVDDDGNGFTDDYTGWNFAYNNNNPTDDQGHGTNVTGIIGSTGNNSIGFAGVDWNCKLMILKGLDNNNSGFYSWWQEAIYYAVDNGAKVINMSVGGSSFSSSLQTAINYAISNNVSIVASMMNFNNAVPYYPAAYSGVIGVGSTNPNDQRSNPFFWSASSGSNYGSHISVCAPGNYIFGPNYQSNTNYTSYWGGTSQAAPHVSGVVSLMLSQNPGLNPNQIKSIIEFSSEDQVGNPSEDMPGWDQFYGHGRLNAHNALTMAIGIDEKERNIPFMAYPNPAGTEINVIFSKLPFNKSSICIYNMSGIKVYERTTLNLQNRIYLNFSPGIYAMNFHDGLNSYTRKIVIH
ncbi:MAG: T9SS C-terminal target domain-containing protein [Bacteroidetes bacterium]|nr:MAG: T9SS C-terminal target domain-containing protein [Bacteroidota bacterium]REK05722.1 MAG: T9SS C-terminal target domain-containing protein [Bacteroidota bacterium]REK31972.1 MAG: T9SS C-terminal target domain-containing protein [Bacteroidota bacterium]REK50037.1 MAG: T9SS C-terminal target domain-containing protein [Bacteroidota bacterium]